MSQPFKQMFAVLPNVVQGALRSWGIHPDEVGAGFIKTLWRKESDQLLTIQFLMRQYPDGLKSDQKAVSELESLLWQVMGALAGAAQASRTMSDMEPWEKAMYKYYVPPAVPKVSVIPDHMFKKWQRITKVKLLDMEPSTMRAMELRLKSEWSMKLVRMLIPYADQLPEVAKRLQFEDPLKEIADLFGKNRWGGAQVSCEQHTKSHAHPPNNPPGHAGEGPYIGESHGETTSGGLGTEEGGQVTGVAR